MIKKGYGKNVLEVSHNEYIDFIRIGKLCELVFVRILSNHGIECNCEEILVPCKYEHRKGSDLILTHSKQEVDIKAANKPFHKRLLVREDQFRAHIHDIYVGAKYWNDDKINFQGYILGKKLKSITPKDFGHGRCRHIFLKNLELIEIFIQLCESSKRVK
ncbi:MAG: hypothetical protein GF308_16065 [Candidatus Heimdallarchaeota archaeon]|nr:hypothetical protein [Candidatus Heimdallarchaeota archaeon]